MVGADTRAITITSARTRNDLGGARGRRSRARTRGARTCRVRALPQARQNLVPSVATRERHVEGTRGGPRVTLIDCGVKRAILRELTALGSEVTVVPYDATEEELLARRSRTRSSFHRVRAIRPICRKRSKRCAGFFGRKPLFGVCLGHQLLALACGATDVQACRTDIAAGISR